MSAQIPFDLTPDPDFSFGRFEMDSSNAAAVKAVQSWPDWPLNILAISGVSGSGKTHLGQAWAQVHNGVTLSGPHLHGVSQQWTGRPVFLDDADGVSESVLFAIMNMALNGDIMGLLLAASTPPSLWSVDLPDLASRLRNVHTLTLGAHEDALLEPIVRKLFEDRGRDISRDSVQYILTHSDRSVAALKARVAELDTEASAQKKDLTKAFIIRALKSR